MLGCGTIEDFDLRGRRVFIRVDYNVPLDEAGNVTDDSRIRRSLPTVNYALDHGGRVILASHLGRPKGKPDPGLSLKPVAMRLSRLLEKEVRSAPDCIGPQVEEMVENLRPGEVLLLENLRFHPGETKNDTEFAQALARLADVYINDAFGTAHRKHASTYGIVQFVKEAGVGFLMKKEIEYFERALVDPRRPLLAIIGGAKVSTKIGILESLLEKVDKMIIGGAMAFTFYRYLGWPTGNSMVEEDMVDVAGRVMKRAWQGGVKLYVPVDVVVAPELSPHAESRTVPCQEIPQAWMGLDIGPATITLFEEVIADAQTIIWNGPMGVFEIEKFKNGTFSVARAIGRSSALSIAGGGDTDVAIHRAGVTDQISYISTGGGAFLELLEKGTLPALEVLKGKGE
ncbi:MAG: phosphoglycerate kinase [Aquificota bacterium]|nr:MAG: phosphoglycerate kinase [Aquificota bacterium]